jgi:hypothetical protein
MSRVLAVFLALLALPAATATAKVRWFHSPSGNIQCEVASHDARGNYAYCQTFEPAASVKLDLRGHSRLCRGMGCLGDGPENAFTLAYGRSVTVGAFRCSSSTAGMRCVVGRHGFAISRAGVRRF